MFNKVQILFRGNTQSLEVVADNRGGNFPVDRNDDGPQKITANKNDVAALLTGTFTADMLEKFDEVAGFGGKYLRHGLRPGCESACPSS